MYQVPPPLLYCTVSDGQDLGMRLPFGRVLSLCMYIAMFLQVFYSHWEVYA